MSSFSPQFLDELRARVSLEDVVGKRVKLIRRGREYVGLSPFQKEKTPSFTVVPDKGFYHCFSSGEHGDVIDFVMKVEGLSFPEAVERLAAQAGMEIPTDSPEEREKDRQRQTLYDAMDVACAQFQKMLRMPEGKAALAYLHGRGLQDSTIERFRLGYAPDSRGTMKGALAREGIPEELMREAGLIRRPDDGRPDFDYFRGRVMFPITDRRGRVVAFGGRIMAKGEPKYLNSPESAIFQKRHVLYGLTQALKPARDGGRIVVTEGYMDVISLHQAGFDFAVAPLGTALTEDHLQALWKIVHEPTVCFDGDTAGQKAAMRVADHALALLKPGYSLRFALLPSGEDPDSLIKARGAAAMAEVLAATLPLSEILWRMETQGRMPTTPEERAGLQDRLARQALRIGDSTVRSHFLRAFKDRLWNEWREAGQRGKGAGRDRRPAPHVDIPPAAARATGADPLRGAQQVLLAIVLRHPDIFEAEGERLGTLGFADAGLDRLRQAVVGILSGQPDLDAAGLARELAAAGLNAESDALLGEPLIRHHRKIAAGADAESVLATWRDTLETLQRTAFAAERETIKERLAGDLTPDGWRRQQAALRAAIGDSEG
jgi:DNA primase